MSIPRFFYQNTINNDSNILLPKNIILHSIQALRMKNGDPCILFNGNGIDYYCIIKIINNKIYATVKNFYQNKSELPGKIILVQAITVKNKMDLIVEKATELGVNKIIPLNSNRIIKKFNSEKSTKYVNHWKNIAISASEQCGRNQIMNIEYPISFHEFIKKENYDLLIICEPCSNNKMKDILYKYKNTNNINIAIIIGPEGGWTESEKLIAKTHNILDVNIGPRILRTETAGIVAITSILTILNWF
ncbi:Ribosomal RNA small subunit methyltransferase E [Candidatus Kinetoplastibacterium sorsogonicusi]|uniref:Ribosomal RNA small subunit methyltransferase E n=1 Tax=Candidatus Kinetoplastidibacterium kentomonadis TaxID=1576550 RepID=A0A3Q8F387_9PROT|nr:16S rRNA (uracil(1498)-N(3))-methyltransferase [Candidatus Kinetoplastibacterium sorsogonicusi]AWD32262.1 Ribosomal RNA small subunit methyltransferase E [Candidatus Kinetoplastibacterium sorsogonicusi]